MPVANRPVLIYVIDNLADAGIRDIGVIISPETGNEIQAALGDGVALGSRIHLHPPRSARRARARGRHREVLSSTTPTSYVPRRQPHRHHDQRFGARIPRRHELRGLGDAERGSQPVRVRRRRGRCERASDQALEKPKEPKSNLALVGIYMFRPRFSTRSTRSSLRARGELEITDAISKLIELGGKVQFSRSARGGSTPARRTTFSSPTTRFSTTGSSPKFWARSTPRVRSSVGCGSSVARESSDRSYVVR